MSLFIIFVHYIKLDKKYIMEVQYRNANKEIFATLKDKWLLASPEEIVRQNFICHLVNEYGYNLNQMEQEMQVSNSQRGQGRARADIVIWRNEQERKDRKNAFIVVECKAEKITVRKEDYFQGSNYATWARAKFFITTNEKETKFFKVLEEKLPIYIEEIIDIPQAKDAENEKEINKLLAQLKKFERDEFQKLLFACHDVIRNNDKLSPEMAFDEISKVLFMKIREERKQNSVFSKERFLQLKKIKEDYDNDVIGKKDETPFYKYLFEQTKKEFAKDEIFVDTDTLRIRETSFLQIVEKLQKYNLSNTDDDVKGIAFEEFLGKTFRGDLGQFFTPRTLVEFVVSLLDIQENELVCDPCCGTGGFLIKAFEYVREKIETDIQTAKEQLRNELLPENFDKLPQKEQQTINEKLNKVFLQLNKQLESTEENSRLKHLSYNCIFGTDAEPRSARTAKMNMIMHGDGHGGVHHHDGLLNVNGIFENRFDVIITNPPFGASVSKDLEITENDRFTDQAKINHYIERYGDDYKNALLQVNDNVGKKVLSLFETGAMSGLTEVLFVERCLNLLRKGGRMGIVLPEGFLNGANLQKIRDFVESKAKIIAIVSVPQEVFISAGATVKSSLVFLKKFTQEEETQYKQITQKVTLELKTKYEPEIIAKEEIHKNIWHKIQAKRDYIKDVKSIKTSKSEKDLQIMLADMDIAKLQKEHKEAKASFDTWKKELDTQIQTEIKAEIKNRFSYALPIIQAESAGINSTGQKSQNDLLDIIQEFKEYRKTAKLWETNTIQYTYSLDENQNLQINSEKVNF
jgi:type I restriction enzyme M protein